MTIWCNSAFTCDFGLPHSFAWNSLHFISSPPHVCDNVVKDVCAFWFVVLRLETLESLCLLSVSTVCHNIGQNFVFWKSCKIYEGWAPWVVGKSEYRFAKWYLKRWWVVQRCLRIYKAPHNLPLFVALLLNHFCALYGFLTLLTNLLE
jgi:hypothetical protein